MAEVVGAHGSHVATRRVRLWPLPLVAALLPVIATLVVLRLYAGQAAVPCNPFIDDCVSISRMARQDAAIHLFRSLVLPAAVLQLLTWLAAASALGAAGLARRDVLMLMLFGTSAGVALVLYGSYLGSDGEVYRALRRWGTLIYFGGTYIAMVLFARAVHRLHAMQRLALPPQHRRVLLALLAFIAAIGLGHAFVSLGPFDELEDRIENLAEWWGASALMLCFGVMSSLWQRWSLVTTLAIQRPRC